MIAGTNPGPSAGIRSALKGYGQLLAVFGILVATTIGATFATLNYFVTKDRLAVYSAALCGDQVLEYGMLARLAEPEILRLKTLAVDAERLSNDAQGSPLAEEIRNRLNSIQRSHEEWREKAAERDCSFIE